MHNKTWHNYQRQSAYIPIWIIQLLFYFFYFFKSSAIRKKNPWSLLLDTSSSFFAPSPFLLATLLLATAHCALSIISICELCISTSFPVKSTMTLAALTRPFLAFLLGFWGTLYFRFEPVSGDVALLSDSTEPSESSSESFNAASLVLAESLLASDLTRMVALYYAGHGTQQLVYLALRQTSRSIDWSSATYP